MTNYVIKLSSGRLCDMCVYVCERKRERGSYTYEHYDKWGMINKSVAKDLSSILINIKMGQHFSKQYCLDTQRQRRGMGQRTEEVMEEKQTRAPSKGKSSFHRPRWPSLPLS